MILINEIVAPPTAQIAPPKPPPLPTPPHLDRIDEEIVSTIREHGPLKIWVLINVVAEKEGAGSRAACREARLSLWHDRVKRLRWLGLIHSVGRNEVSTTKRVHGPAPSAGGVFAIRFTVLHSFSPLSSVTNDDGAKTQFLFNRVQAFLGQSGGRLCLKR